MRIMQRIKRLEVREFRLWLPWLTKELHADTSFPYKRDQYLSLTCQSQLTRFHCDNPLATQFASHIYTPAHTHSVYSTSDRFHASIPRCSFPCNKETLLVIIRVTIPFSCDPTHQNTLIILIKLSHSSFKNRQFGDRRKNNFVQSNQYFVNLYGVYKQKPLKFTIMRSRTLF